MTLKKLILFLKYCNFVEGLNFISAITISSPEEERLRVENEKLRSEVEELKSQLILAEIKNGGTIPCTVTYNA
jgi:hypothetical protein